MNVLRNNFEMRLGLGWLDEKKRLFQKLGINASIRLKRVFCVLIFIYTRLEMGNTIDCQLIMANNGKNE